VVVRAENLEGDEAAFEPFRKPFPHVWVTVYTLGAMPIYEFVCMSCEEHFEELVRGDTEVACPQCGATKVAKQLSTFAMVGGGSSESPSFGGGGGGCCGGSCGCGH
jgi:putative FmdB family regulatory protein